MEINNQIQTNRLNGSGHSNGTQNQTVQSHKPNVKVFSQPLISIIIPVLQEEKILEETLKYYTRELRQKYHCELIVSDGGSRDNSVEIAKKYSDVVVVHTEERRQSIAEGRNMGANAAHGDILVFINADTIPANIDNFFSKISKWLDSQNLLFNYDALACKVDVMPEEKLFKDTIFYSSHNLYMKILNKLGIGMGRGECQIVKTEIFKKVRGYNSDIIAGEDFDFYRRIARIGKISFVDDLLVYESPRRFRKFGYLPILWSWTINSLSVIFFNRSVSKEWEAVR